MGGDLDATARRLEVEGLQEAVAFFADVEAVPEWADFEAMRAGAAMGRRNPIGMLFGMHGGLPFTYIDPATAEVMGSTGRLSGRAYRRRYWETATGFVGALDVDGMKPGRERWIQWVRVRFLHTMIRQGILRGGDWSLPGAMPIGQVPSACTAHIFGPYRVNIIRYFGGVVTQEEEDSFSLMWRWVARIEGANNQLLGRTPAEQLRISERMLQFLYGPTEKAAEMTAGLIEGAATMRAYMLPKRLHRAVVHNLLSEEMMQTLPGKDAPTDLGLPHDPIGELAVAGISTALKAVNQIQRLPIVKRLAAAGGQPLLDFVVDRGLDGIRADYRPTSGEAAHQH
jgi:hypothetical protein